MKISYSVSDLAGLLGPVEVEGPRDARFSGIATLREASGSDLSFLGNSRYRSEVAGSRARVILLPDGFEGSPREGQTFVRVQNPSLALGILCRDVERRIRPRPAPGIHPSAVIDRDAVVAETATIGPFVSVGKGSRVGEGTVVSGHVHLGDGVEVGEDCLLAPHVVVGDHCTLGDRVFLQPGVIIGADGFGYEFDGGQHQKIPQIGRVIIEDDVEIGANSTVDRARFAETRIGQGSKIDNLVQLGHNVRVGRHCLIVAQTGVSGSTTIGDFVVIGGQTGIAGHVTIGDHTRIGGKSGVAKSLPAGSTVQGVPLQDIRLYHKMLALQKRLPEFFSRLSDLEAQVGAVMPSECPK